MQFRVDRNRGQARMPYGKHDLEILRHVLHGQCHPVAAFKAEAFQSAGQPFDPVSQVRVSEDDAVSHTHGSTIGVFQCIAFDPVGKIHVGFRVLWQFRFWSPQTNTILIWSASRLQARACFT